MRACKISREAVFALRSGPSERSSVIALRGESLVHYEKGLQRWEKACRHAHGAGMFILRKATGSFSTSCLYLPGKNSFLRLPEEARHVLLLMFGSCRAA